MAHAQETAQQANLDARFGRNELVMEHVAPAARDAYAAHHRGWGTTVRVADLELAGMRAGSEHDVEVIVRVAWYRPEEEELHVTTLKQDWREAGGWQLVSEQRLAGDVGLLGETVVFESPREPRPPAQFPTIRLGGAEE
jgi:hypothetical protein